MDRSRGAIGHTGNASRYTAQGGARKGAGVFARGEKKKRPKVWTEFDRKNQPRADELCGKDLL